MKKILLLPFFLTVVFAKAQSSIYYPLPDSGAVWNFSATGMCFWGFPADFYSVRTDGDTVINGSVYHKLATPFVLHQGSCDIVYPGYDGAFRNDSLARKVYYFPPADTAEHLLYDFTLQPGDTLQGWLRTTGLMPAVVDSVDSVLVGADYRRRLRINCYGVDIIEGVGSTYGLFKGLPGCVTDANDISLQCFLLNGHTLYPDTITDCRLIDTDPTAPRRMDILLVLPNPAKTELFLKTEYEGAAAIFIRDLLGRWVKSQEVRFRGGYSDKISVEELPRGSYLLEVTCDRFSFVRKLVLE